MLPSVYIETTVVSYLTAWPSQEPIRASHQQITKRWWEKEREQFRLFVSSLVIEESSRGDANAAEDRLAALQELEILQLGEVEFALARRLVADKAIPESAEADALHIAASATNGIEYLLTWNCTHIANARNRLLIVSVCQAAGVTAPVICTPEELLGEYDEA